MGKVKDHTGERYGRLVVLELTEKRKKSSGCAVWKCQCDCGKIVEVPSSELRNGARTKSCGCLLKDNLRAMSKTHGGTHDRLYKVWMSMRRRCYDKTMDNYSRYGERGITVCEEWHDYEKFKNWAMNHGYDEKAEFGQCTLDRINTDGNYCPENCRFVPASVQQNNKRNNKLVTYKGITKTIAEWEHLTGSKRGFIRERLESGWAVEDALTTPPKYNSKNHTFVGVNF